MFLEKFSRFYRRYDFRFAPRRKDGPHLPVQAEEGYPSIVDALETQIKANKALEVQANGDIVELLKVELDPEKKSLSLLFHRASPNAADPMYRKKARKAAGVVSVRKATRADDEEQSVSAHLVIDTGHPKKGVFRAALEEIPGISMSIVRRIIAVSLTAYKYEYEKGGETKETYCTFKPEGVQSETLSNALRDGQLHFITLVRPARPDFVDAAGIFEPVNEIMRLRVKGKITSNNWKEQIGALIKPAKEAGWTDFNLDLELDDDRHRTVKIERDQEAKEILFVRSEQAFFKKEVPVCAVEIHDEIVDKALEIARQ